MTKIDNNIYERKVFGEKVYLNQENYEKFKGGFDFEYYESIGALNVYTNIKPDSIENCKKTTKVESKKIDNQQIGLRYNQGKAPLSMVLEANNALIGCAQVLAFGAEKYDRGNWRKGLKTTEIADSLLRHLSAYLSGEDTDSDSKLLHVDHILCNALFLSETFRTHPQLDDRSIKDERTS